MDDKALEDEQKAWADLAKETKPDGSKKFTHAESNAEFWKNQNMEIEEILKILQEA